MRKKTLLATMIIGSLAFCTFIVLSVTTTTADETKELKLLHVIMRHGERTPADTYPNDPYINETFYPVGWGQLTNKGKLKLHEIGKFLRERYGKFLGDRYTPELFYTQSTDVDRTKASMQLVNSGLWPPVGDQNWGPLNWQPIPIHSEPLSEDNLLLVRKPCAQYHIELEKVKQTDEIQKKLKEIEPMMKKIAEHTGKEIKDFDDVQDVFSTLKAEEGFNFTLPPWTKDYYPDKMMEPTIFSFILNAYTDKLNRLKGGVLLKKLIQDWKSVADDTVKPKERKAFLYGGHDSTISNLMRTLGVWDPQLPDYAITILLELSKDKNTKEFGIEVYLRNSTEVPPFKLTIPGCDSFCKLTELEKLKEPVIPVNWEEECKSDDPNYVPPAPGGP